MRFSELQTLKNEIAQLKTQLQNNSKSNNKSGTEFKCTFCGRKFHTEDKCWKKHGKPESVEKKVFTESQSEN